jgi:hypothetical protein
VATFEDIAGKAEWEGGLDEALDWFEPDEVPEEIRDSWRDAKNMKRMLEAELKHIGTFLPES